MQYLSPFRPWKSPTAGVGGRGKQDINKNTLKHSGSRIGIKDWDQELVSRIGIKDLDQGFGSRIGI